MDIFKHITLGKDKEAVVGYLKGLTADGQPRVLLDENNAPFMIMTPPEYYGRKALDMLQQVWERNKDLPPEVIEKEVEKAVYEARVEEHSGEGRI